MEEAGQSESPRLPVSVFFYALGSFLLLSLLLLLALNAFRIDKTYVGSALPSQAGSVSGTSRSATHPQDASGFLSFGPYLKVTSGDYVVSVTYSADQTSNVLDFFINQANLQLGKATLVPGQKVTATFAFTVPPSSEGQLLESRLFFGGQGSLTLYSIRIQQSSSWLSLLMNNKKAFFLEFALALVLAGAYWFSQRRREPQPRENLRELPAGEERWALFWYFGAATVIGLLVQFLTGFHSHQHSDSLLLSIGGYQLPTMFYWGQNQYFWAVAMVLSVLPSQELQLILQVLIYFLMLAAIPVLMARILQRPSVVRFSVLFTLVLTAFSAMFFFELSYQAYVPALFFALLSLVLMDSSDRESTGSLLWLFKLLSAALSLVLAYLTAEPSVILWLVFFSFRFFRAAHLRASNNSLSIEGFDLRGVMLPGFLMALMAGQFLVCVQSITGHYLAFFGITPRKMAFNFDPIAIDKALRALQDNVYGQFFGNPWSLVFLSLLGLGGLFLLVRARSQRSWATFFLVFVAPAILLWLVMACLDWVAQNAYSARYTLFSLFLLMGGLAFALDHFSTYRRTLPFFFGVTTVVCLAFVIRFGFLFGPMPLHSPASVVKGPTDLTALSQVDGIVGGYWDVWPVVWKLDAAYGKPYKGIAYRGEQVLQTARSRNELPEELTLAAFGKPDAIKYASAQLLPEYRQVSAVPSDGFTLLTFTRAPE